MAAFPEKKPPVAAERSQDDGEFPAVFTEASCSPDAVSDDDFDDFLNEQDVLNNALKAMMEREPSEEVGSSDCEEDASPSVTASINHAAADGSHGTELSVGDPPPPTGAQTSLDGADAPNVSDKPSEAAAGPQSDSNKAVVPGLIPSLSGAGQCKPSLPISNQPNYAPNTSVLRLHQVNEVCGNNGEEKTKGGEDDEEGEAGGLAGAPVLACEETDTRQSQNTPALSVNSGAHPATTTRHSPHAGGDLSRFLGAESEAVGFVERSADGLRLMSESSREQSPENAISHIVGVIPPTPLGIRAGSKLTGEHSPVAATAADSPRINSDKKQQSQSAETIVSEARPDLWISESDSTFLEDKSLAIRTCRGGGSIGAHDECAEAGEAAAFTSRASYEEEVAGATFTPCTYEESARRTGLTTFSSSSVPANQAESADRESTLRPDHISMIEQTAALSAAVVLAGRSIQDGHSSSATATTANEAPAKTVAAASGDLNANDLPCGGGSKRPPEEGAHISHPVSSSARANINTTNNEKCVAGNQTVKLSPGSTTSDASYRNTTAGSGDGSITSASTSAAASSGEEDKMRCKPGILRHYVVDEGGDGGTILTAESICQSTATSDDADLAARGIGLSPVSPLPTTNAANLGVNHCPVNGNEGSLDAIKSELEWCGETDAVVGSDGPRPDQRRVDDDHPSPDNQTSGAGSEVNTKPNHSPLDATTCADNNDMRELKCGTRFSKLSDIMVSMERRDKAVYNKRKSAAAAGGGVAPSCPHISIPDNAQSDNNTRPSDHHHIPASQQVAATDNKACISSASRLLPRSIASTCSASKSISSQTKALGGGLSSGNRDTKEYCGSTRTSIYSHLLRRQPPTACNSQQRPRSMHSVQVSSCLTEDNTFPADATSTPTLLPRSYTCQEEFSRCGGSLRSSKDKLSNRRSLVLESLKLCDFRGCPCRTFRLLGKSASSTENNKAASQETSDSRGSTLRNEPLRTCTCQRHPATQTGIVTPKHSGNKNTCLQTNPDCGCPESYKNREEILTSDDNFRKADDNQNREEEQAGVVSHGPSPPGQMVMTEAMKYTRDKLLHRCKEDLVVLNEHFKKQSQAVSEELVQLLQDRHELQEQVEMRRIAIEQLLRFQTEASDVKELSSVQMSVILPESEQR